MKILIASLFALLSFGVFSQLSGDLTKYDRKITNDISYKMSGAQDGICVFDISVDAKGNVTSVTLLNDASNITSTPTIMKGKNALKKMKFSECTYCPKYHHGHVAITFEKKVEKNILPID